VLIVFMISFSSLFFWHNKHQTVGGGSVFLLRTHEVACRAVSFRVSFLSARLVQEFSSFLCYHHHQRFLCPTCAATAVRTASH